MDFLIATHNMKKRDELQRILSPLGIRVLTAEQAGVELTDVEETGVTFEENAALKSRSAAKESGMPSIGDDSGLAVDYLDGAPGVYSARYSGVHGDDEANNKKLLANLKGVPDEERGAKFVCAVCCTFPDGREILLRGECKGKIGYEPDGSGGFGYDPLFVYEGKSFARLTPEEKDAVSHRGKAMRALAAELKDYIK